MALKVPAPPVDPLPVGPETHTAAAQDATARCPHCSGAVRAVAPWCTQCWADLRPAPPPEPLSEPAAVPEPAPAVSRGLAGWPCAHCGHVNPVELDACAACGSGFLTALRKQEAPLLVLPGVGDLTRLGRAQRLGLAAGVVLVVLLLVVLLSLLTG